MKVGVILPAAGQSQRSGLGFNKVFLDFEGQPLVSHTVQNLFKNSSVNRVVLVIRQEDEPRFTQVFEKLALAKKWPEKKLQMVYGGLDRAGSVRQGLKYLEQHVPEPIIAVHDAARPFISEALFERVTTAAQTFGAALPVLPISDTIRHKTNQQIVDRGLLYRCQTPQAFKSQYLGCFFSDLAVQQTFTDDISYIEVAGHHIQWVEGEECNFKLTTKADIHLLPWLNQQFTSKTNLLS